MPETSPDLRILLEVEPPLLEELLASLLAGPGVSLTRSARARAGGGESFDVLICGSSSSTDASVASVIELPTAGATGLAVVSTSSGTKQVQIDQLADLQVVVAGLRHRPTNS